MYSDWPSPVVIVSDGAYGVSGFPGDSPTPAGLADWYRSHVEEWSKAATGETTLWFWNTEVGWATVHPMLLESGWEYVGCNIWDKGIAHVSGNTNSKTLRKFPVVTEVCAQYVKAPKFSVGGRVLGIKEWLRWEWERSGLPLSRSNEACGVRSAATRKYLTKDHVWYFPPPEAFQRLLIWRIIDATSEPGDVVWEPFGGLCTAAVVCADSGRECYSAELLPEYHAAAVQRLKDNFQLRLV